ncbi:transglutaminase family protein [Uliginosibacterium sp. 31-16]|uniref:transglutaminase family protein n=1 Tax=Uliginosibacterium sp. 31-16 TaxID=3068315 RepID=UPI00273D1B37|nr:transglutaminase family protein [Uliginosibacterium sp. 31-16]MDP5241181.1 transglutaminase family protein [Uliginosibacterium sp. 31-16]
MSIQVALNHVTHYRYDKPISLGPQIVRLRPAPHSRTRVLSYSLRVTPAEHFINWQQDPASNYLARLVIPGKTREFRVEVDLLVEMAVQNPFDFFLEPEAMNSPFVYNPNLATELAPYLLRLPATPAFKALLDSVPREKMATIDYLVALNQRLQHDIRYLVRLEPGVQTPEETLTKASGSCRDSAWLLVQLLRHLGLAARFVSGYLIQLKPDVKSLDGPSGTEADFTDLHAWCEVYLPGAGWVGLDPTSGLFAGEGHIPLACSPEPSSAAPVEGAVEACKVEFVHHMNVTRMIEPARVTLPYSDGQWRAIEALGQQVDADLAGHDVRLTQGGEPTFVSIDDRDGAEWNTEAMGPKKRGLSASLLAQLKAKYAPQGLLHFGQGKWYPGEQLPRWSLNLYWREDGEPLWSDASLQADETRDYGVDEVRVGEFLRCVAQQLGVTAQHALPAYEDALYYLWRERNLPGNVDPLDSRLDDPLERARLARVFGQGLDKIVGWVLPLARDAAGKIWQSSPWFMREGRCYLIPGDSPVGYRLPLDRQPWVCKAEYPYAHPRDPGEVLPPLPINKAARKRRAEDIAASAVREPVAFESADWIVRTAMCAEARAGRLYLFMPPLSALEDYLEIVAAIEATAKAMQLPVVLEGYEPPRDPRLTVLRVTPDPGVIEVNVQPVASWRELVEQTTHLYEVARETRLSTEKFMLDGRHTGTGGGNHIVFGGATPADSPFLRRPDLLGSMIAYWHNHPSLSYLFSGLFIGPTSQAPRIDEARNDSVYEIEIALAEMHKRTEASLGPCPPWLVDRLLRNLLIDVTGNTHRAEFCIDKLYSPDSSAGRLGLLEMRGFEMPPHAQMSLAQQLLMRALLAKFWQLPYQPARLKRWGTELHDRFMLPHCVWDDFCDVITELQAFGYPLQPEWFAPHFEFRFPKIGDFAASSVKVELRLALEPWHVMGEENAGGGAVRYVDASVERLQVKVSGLISDRQVLTCNGSTIPLQPTGVAGEFVAAVRYRAWSPASSLHPTIPVQAPLTLDLVDTWMERSLGGCQYHVAHPGGRNHETFPVNALEAEARRLARFFRTGHTPGKMRVMRETSNPDFPFTLDLRRG